MIAVIGLALAVVVGLVLADGLVGRRNLAAEELLALGGGLGLALVVVVVLLWVMPPLVTVLAVALLVALTPVARFRTRMRGLAEAQDAPAAPPAAARRQTAVALAMLVALVAVAGYFRFRHLGYSEFQGDEARAMLMAARLVQADDPEVLLMHKKGPLEVLLPAPGVKRGDRSEGGARLPFALAGLLGVLAAFGLGRRLWGAPAGWLAATLLALDGYLVAFSRIVQYQSLVFLFSVLAVWCAVRFRERAPFEGRYLALCGLFLGLGSWAHYEMVFAAAPVAWFVARRGLEDGWPPRAWLRRLALPLVIAAVVTTSFYVPFALHPHFAETARYIAERRIGGGLLYEKLGDYFLRASFYNASYYVLFMVAVLVAAVVFRLRGAGGSAGPWLAAAWLAAFASLVLWPGAFLVGGLSLAILVFLPVIALLVASRRIEPEWRGILLWFAVPFLVAGFLTEKPHTHFYTMVPAWALLVGEALDRGRVRLLAALEGVPASRRALALGAVSAVAIAAFGAFAFHQYVVFVRHEPEYKRVYPEAKLPGYWMPFGDEPPRGGYFGFPYRAGWNAIAALFASGRLVGDYDSNEEALVTGWYTLGAPRCTEGPRYYFVAWRPQDAEELPDDVVGDRSAIRTTVRVGGRPKLEVYIPDDDDPDSMTRHSVEDVPIDPTDRGGELPVWLDDPPMPGATPPSGPVRPGPRLPVSQALELPLPQHPTDVRFGDAIRLTGLDTPLPLAEDAAVPTVDAAAGPIPLVLLWEAIGRVAADYSVFVHVVDANGETAAQSDRWPDCGRSATSEWRVGELHTDAHAPRLARNANAGTYSVRVGLYDAATGARLTRGGEDAVEVLRVRVAERKVDASGAVRSP